MIPQSFGRCLIAAGSLASRLPRRRITRQQQTAARRPSCRASARPPWGDLQQSLTKPHVAGWGHGTAGRSRLEWAPGPAWSPGEWNALHMAQMAGCQRTLGINLRSASPGKAELCSKRGRHNDGFDS